MRAQGDGFRSGTGAGRMHALAMFFAQTVQVGRVQRIVRDADEIGLRQIDGAARRNAGKELSECGQFTSLLVIFIRRSIHVEGAPGFIAGFFQIGVQFPAGLAGFHLRLLQRLAGVMFQLIRRLSRLFTGVILITSRARAKRDGHYQKSCSSHGCPRCTATAKLQAQTLAMMALAAPTATVSSISALARAGIFTRFRYSKPA